MQSTQIVSQNIKLKKIKVGICAMQKRLLHTKYQQIFSLFKSQQFQLIYFYPLLNQHWSKWPVVDALIQFHKDNIPYVMIRQYVKKYQPFMINDLDSQQLIWDRTVIYDILSMLNIPIPQHIRIVRNKEYIDQIEKENFGIIYSENDQQITYEKYMKSNAVHPNKLRNFVESRLQMNKNYEIEENQDSIILRSQKQEKTFNKPFFEKPINARDHSVCIYYPAKLGGGRRLLSRKNHGKCSSPQSQYQKNSSLIRREGNYIYEQFLPSNALDIKVYVFGDFYIAQSRRSPTLQVQKTQTKAQLRYYVKLTEQQKQYCQNIIKYLKQEICGIDILRSKGKSYVIDINGWCFANANFLGQKVRDYWQICSKLLKNKIYQRFFHQKIQELQYSNFDQYMIKFQNQMHHSLKLNGYNQEEYKDKNPLQKKKTQNAQLVGLIAFFTAQEQNINNSGQNFRISSYQNKDSLDLYYKYRHKLNIYSTTKRQNYIGQFLKGYFNIKGQLSPTLTSMIQLINQNSDQEKDMNFSLQRILKDLQFWQLDKNNQIILSTSIYFVLENQIKKLVNLILNNLINQQKQQPKLKYEKINQIIRLEMRIYKSFLEKDKEMQIKICFQDLQNNQIEEKNNCFNLNYKKFFNILNQSI